MRGQVFLNPAGRFGTHWKVKKGIHVLVPKIPSRGGSSRCKIKSFGVDKLVKKENRPTKYWLGVISYHCSVNLFKKIDDFHTFFRLIPGTIRSPLDAQSSPPFYGGEICTETKSIWKFNAATTLKGLRYMSLEMISNNIGRFWLYVNSGTCKCHSPRMSITLNIEKQLGSL